MKKERESVLEPGIVVGRLGLAAVAFFGLAGFWMKNPDQFAAQLTKEDKLLSISVPLRGTDLKILRQSIGVKNQRGFAAIDCQTASKEFNPNSLKRLFLQLENMGIRDCRIRVFAQNTLKKSMFYILAGDSFSNDAQIGDAMVTKVAGWSLRLIKM
jgi:hypothetical protein